MAPEEADPAGRPDDDDQPAGPAEDAAPAARTRADPIVSLEDGDAGAADDAPLAQSDRLQLITEEEGHVGGGVPAAIHQLSLAVASLAADIRLEHKRSAADMCDRLEHLERAVGDLSDGVRAGASVADALEHLDGRLSAIDEATTSAATDVRVLVAGHPGPLDRLTAVENALTEWLGEPAEPQPGRPLPPDVRDQPGESQAGQPAASDAGGTGQASDAKKQDDVSSDNAG